MMSPIPVVSPSFCFPQPHDLEFTKTIEGGKFGVNDANGNLIFKVKESGSPFLQKRVILDAAGLPLVTLQEKATTMHRRCKVYRGEGTNDKDLIFSATRSSMFQIKTKLLVFLANNKVDDYTVRGSWSKRACTVYARDSSTIVAQMHMKEKGKKFMVRVFPNIDHVFIVALIDILDDIYSSRGGGGGNCCGEDCFGGGGGGGGDGDGDGDGGS